MEQKAKIIIIDDDQDICELLKAFFRLRDYETIIFNNAEDALKKLSESPVACDVVVADLMLPGLSGIDLVREMKTKGIEVPVILLTSEKSVEVAVEAIHAGAYDFVVKPIHFPQLQVSVERALYLSNVKSENSVLKTIAEDKDDSGFAGVVGRSATFRKVVDLARRVSNSTANVLITGESGTGKEIVARTIHYSGSRKEAPFVAINCSAIPENLLESELFGYAKGAFTGAHDKKIGLFEEAEGGTLFLDEIGDLNLGLQAKLLRVLQERKIKRIGENQMRDIDVRIIAATHRDLQSEVSEGRFREDLYFRLNVIPIRIPPLRERPEDVLPLAEYFFDKYKSENSQGHLEGFSKEAVEALLKNPWQGNVRELENTIERAVILSPGPTIQPQDLSFYEMPKNVKQASESFNIEEVGEKGLLSLDEVVKSYIRFALKKNNGAKEKTAKDIKIDRKTLYRKLKEIEAETRMV
ncbi:MAG: sigma-54 dependent transcriptional regulator [Bdellovibrionota bacterium]